MSLKKEWMLYKVEGFTIDFENQQCNTQSGLLLICIWKWFIWVWQECRPCFIVSPPRLAHGCHNYRKAKRLRNLLSKPWNSGKETMTCSYPKAGRCFNAWMSHSFSTVPTLGIWTSLEILRKKKNIAALYTKSSIVEYQNEFSDQPSANKHLESLERHRLN